MHKINRKTIREIDRDGTERVDPEWVKRRKAWAQQDVFYEKMGADAERLRWERRVAWVLEGRNAEKQLFAALKPLIQKGLICHATGPIFPHQLI